MSTTIDQRVVEMRFDNQQFEKNVSTTMSSLDKLKAKLNLPGSSKGLEDVGRAAKNVDMSGLGRGVDAVKLKFSALQVMGVTALTRITNQAMQAGERMVKALTIDPIKTGLQEYETKINAIQVIQANTRGKNNMEDITKALDDLNTYADKTIYNFAQMTNNIGKFTAQGLDVYEAADAVKGMANLAAASGASAEDMARATYQMSQALSSTIKLMDWNSLRNANMATTELKNTLIDLAKVNGVAIDDMIAKHGSFEQTLSEGWLTGEMFTEAMNIYSGIYSDAELKSKGFTDAQIANFKDLAKMAESAATEVKTFTQLWDVLKETAQSGWTQTWELLIGDFDQAKEMFTGLQVFFSDILNGFSDARNKVLESALGKGFTSLSDKIKGITKPLAKVTEPIDNITKSVKNLGEIADKVILGSFGNGKIRFDKLTEAGYNYYEVQNKVNEKLGDSFRYTDEQIAAQDKLLGSTKKSTEAKGKEGEATEALTEDNKKLIKQLVKMSDAELKAAGYTEDQIAALDELRKTAEKLGIPLEEFIDNLDKINGRYLLIGSFKNIGLGIVDVFKAIGEAWGNIFDSTSEEKAQTLFDVIAGFHKFSSMLRSGITKNADELRRTFEGIFAALDIILILLGGPIRIAFAVFGKVFAALGIGVLDVTAAIGDFIVFYRNWLDSVLRLDEIADIIVKVVGKIYDGLDAILAAFKASDFYQIAKDCITGLLNGFTSGFDTVISWLEKLSALILSTVKNILGIESPSKEFFQIAVDCLTGFINGVIEGVPNVLRAISRFAGFIIDKIKGLFGAPVGDVFKNIIGHLGDFFGGIIDFIKGLNFGQVVATVLTGGLLVAVFKVLALIKDFAAPAAGLREMLEGIGEAFEGLGKKWKAEALKTKSDAILNFAFAIGILVLAIGYLTTLDGKEIAGALLTIAALGLILGAFGVLSQKVGDFKKIFALGTMLLFIGIALRILVGVVDQASQLYDVEGKLKKGAIVVGVLGIFIGALIAISQVAGEHANRAGTMLLRISIAMGILVLVMKLAGTLDKREIQNGIIAIYLMSMLFAGFIAISMLAGEHANRAGSMLLKISIAMGIMVGVIALAASLEPETVKKGLATIGLVSLLFAALIATSQFAGRYASKAGSMLLKISIAIGILAITMKLLATLSEDEMKRSLGVITYIAGIYAAIIGISTIISKSEHLGKTLMQINIAIGAMVGSILILAMLPKETLKKSLTALGAVTLMLTLLIGVTHFAGNTDQAVSVISKLAAALGIMSLSIGLLAVFTDTKDLLRASAALSLVIGAMAILVGVTKFAKGSKDLNKTLSRMVGAIIILSGVIVVLSWIDGASAIKSVIALDALLVGLAGVMVILSNLKEPKTGVLTSMAILALVAGLLAIILNATPRDLDGKKALIMSTALSEMILALAGVMVALSFIETSPDKKIVGTMAVLGLILFELAGVLWVIQDIKTDGIGAKITALIVLLSALVKMVIAIDLLATTPKNLNDWYGQLGVVGIVAALGVVLYELAGLLAILQHIETGEGFVAKITALVVILAELVILAIAIDIFASNPFDKNSWLGEMGFVGIVAALGLVLYELAGLFAILENIETGEDFSAKITAIALLLAELVGLAIAIDKFIKAPVDFKSFLGELGVVAIVAALGGVLFELAGLLDVLEEIETGEDFVAKVSAVALLLGELVLLAIAIDKFIKAPVDFKSFLGELGVVAIVAALGGVMFELAGLLDYLEEITWDESSAAKVTAVVAMLDNLAILAIAIDTLTKTPVNWKALGTGFLKNLGITAMMAGLGGVMFEMSALLKDLEEVTWDETSTAKITAVVAMIDNLALLVGAFGVIGKLTGGSFVMTKGTTDALIAMAEFIGGVSLIAGAMAGLVDIIGEENFETGEGQIEVFLSFVDTALGGIAEVLGNVISRFGEGITSSFPTIGKNLSDFANNAGDFITACKSMDSTALAGAGNLATALLKFTGASLLDGIAKLISFGEGGLSGIGSQLSEFWTNAKSFFTGVGALPEATFSSVESLAGALLTLTKADLIDGLSRLFGITGDGNMFKMLSVYLPGLGTGIRGFATNLGTSFDETTADRVKLAADAFKEIAKAASEIPNEGGWLADAIGDNSIGVWADYLPDAGANIKEFADNLTDSFDQTMADRITLAGDAIKTLAAAASEIPNEGGWLADVIGDNVIDTWVGYLPDVGTNILAFADNLTDAFDKDMYDRIALAGDAITYMAKAASNIPNEGGWLADVIGDNVIDTWAEKLPSVGKNLRDMYHNLGENFDQAAYDRIVLGANAIKDMATAASMIPTDNKEWLDIFLGDDELGHFTEGLPDMGKHLNEFITNIGTFEAAQRATVVTAVQAVGDIAGMEYNNLADVALGLDRLGPSINVFGSDLKSFTDNVAPDGTCAALTRATVGVGLLIDAVDTITEGSITNVKNLGENMKGFGENGVTEFVKAFNNEKAKTAVESAANELADQVQVGVDDAMGDFEADTFVSGIASAITTAETDNSYMYNAGVNLGAGLVNGISAKKQAAYDAGAALATQAKKGVEETAQINSPSKVWYKDGGFMGEGLVMALNDYGTKAYSAGQGVAKSASRGLSDSIGRISDVINSDIDTQPTIRPVLDLSEVSSGADSINSMFGLNPSVKALSNVGKISAMMEENQNGANRDVVRAIHDLGSSIDNMPRGDSYNVNGITYDDGSNITEAIRVLVRESRLERRR